MTLDEATLEAQKRWGPSGDARDTRTEFGQRYEVGAWEAPMPGVQSFRRHGSGGTWEAAFAEATRRQALGPHER